MPRRLNKNTWLGLVFLLASTVIVTLLWWLVGVKNTDFADMWLFFMTAQQPDFFVFHIRGRPLLQSITLPSFRITPNSFVGLNLAFAVGLIMRGVMMYLFTKRISKDILLAAAAGFLAIVYAADDEHMALRLMTLVWVFNWVLLAIWFYHLGLNSRRFWLCALGLLFLSFASLSRETSFPFFFAAPAFFLLYRNPKEKLSFYFKAIALWLGFTMLYFSYYVYVVFVQGSDHQTDSLALENLSNLFPILENIFKRYFLFYWLSIRALPLSNAVLILAMAIGFISLISLLIFSGYNHQNQSWRETIARFGMSLLTGLAIILLGLVLYLPTQFIGTDWRIHIISSAGACLVIMTILRFALLRFPFANGLFSIVAALVIGLASLQSLEQHLALARVSRNMQYIMAQIVEQAPQLEESTQALVIFDPTGRLNAADVFVDFRRLTGFTRGLYANPGLDAIFCSVPTEANPSPRSDVCSFTEESIQIWGKEFFYTDIIAFEVLQPHYQIQLLESIPENYVTVLPRPNLYQPETHICEECPLSSGVESLFYAWPFPEEIAPLSASYEYTPR